MTDAEADAWGPESCELRDGTHGDDSGHAQRNIALLTEAAREGDISREAAAESITRIHRDERKDE